MSADILHEKQCQVAQVERLQHYLSRHYTWAMKHQQILGVVAKEQQ
jgi:hypothetical protein